MQIITPPNDRFYENWIQNSDSGSFHVEPPSLMFSLEE